MPAIEPMAAPLMFTVVLLAAGTITFAGIILSHGASVETLNSSDFVPVFFIVAVNYPTLKCGAS